MKKLLDELEVARDSADSIKEAQAVQLCINIVRAHNPWHGVAELPPERGNTKMFSIVVIVSDDVNTDLGYYDFEYKTWINKSIGSDFTPIKWTYLPGGKP